MAKTLEKEPEMIDKQPTVNGGGHVLYRCSKKPWVWKESIDFHNDTGYGRMVQERIVAMAKHAANYVEEDFSDLPEFAPTNRIEVEVRIIG